MFLKMATALAGVTHLVGAPSHKPEAPGWISHQGTCLD